MKRTRRNFTKEFKQELVAAILGSRISREEASKAKNISIPLLNRWINDFIATTNMKTSLPIPQVTERRKDYISSQQLKLKVAELVLELDHIKKEMYGRLERVA